MSNEELAVDPSNTNMLAAWDGPEGEWWAAQEASFEAGITPYLEPLLAAAAVRPDDTIVDVGCGNGRTTRELARRASSGSAVGIDLSSPMLSIARKRGEEEGLGNVTFTQADAQVHPFEAASFDLAFSRFGVMFFGDPVAAFTNIASAVRPGGRLTMMVWQLPSENEWLREFGAALAIGRDMPAPPPGAPGPAAFGDPDRVRGILEPAGFESVSFQSLREPMSFGATVEDAMRFLSGQGFVRGMTQDLSDDDKAKAMDAMREVVESHATPDGVQFGSATWIITATKP